VTATDLVTTVVVTRDRWPDLQRSLPEHTGPVVLVDNGSRDGTPDQVRAAFPHVRVFVLPDNRGAVARNVGVELARTPYVAFADDDSWWAPGALDRAAEHFEAHPRLGLLAGRMLVGEAEELDPTSALMATSPLPRELDLPGPSVLGFMACGAVVRRHAYLAAGGFDDVVQFAGEEERLALDLAALGWGLAYVDDVVMHHHPSPRRAGDLARATRIARNRVLTALMRRPWPVVATTVRAVLAEQPAGARGVLRALPRAPMALRARRVLPAPVERQRRLLDA
jgi:glycosyltransferase involved in cell wall biosynthesis